MNIHAIVSAILVFISGQQYVQGSNKEDIDIIADLLDTESSKSVVVTAYICWKKEQKLKLLKKLVDSNYISSILDLDEKGIKNNYPNYKQTFILDIDCKNYSNVLSKANTETLFSPSYTWILLSKNPTVLAENSKNFIHFDIFPNSNVILLQNLNNNKYLLREIYKQNKESNDIIMNVISLWQQRDKFGNLKQRIVANNRQDLNKTVLGTSIVVLENDTLNHLDDYREKHVDSITKVNYVLIKHLIEYVNGVLQIYPVDSWGYKIKNTNTYTGMIGSLQKNESEIGGTALFITTERIPMIDYIAMTTPTKIRFVFRQPPLSYEQNIFTLPFTKQLWISSFCLVILAILLLYSTVTWEGRIEDSDSINNSFLDVVMLTFAAVAQQGSAFEPKSGAGKIIMIFTFIALMFLYVSYSANIVALLQSSATNIRTLEDLLESRLKLGADDTVYNRYYMSTATERVRKSMYERKIAPFGHKPHFIPLDDGVKRIREGFYAFHMELGRGYKLVADTFYENEKCGIQEIAFLDVVDTYLAVKKNSTYKEIFTLGLRKLRESGIQNRELSKIYTNKPECHTAGGNFVSVGLIDSYPAFLFLGGGIGISLLLFFLENVFSRNERLNKTCLKIYK